jgi:hypothetical protein
MVTDDEALAAARTLLAYHTRERAGAILDILVEHHDEMIERLTMEIELIPRRTAARNRVGSCFK